MREFITFIAIAITMVILAQNSYPQMLNPDSIKEGKFYSILLADDTWIDAEVVGIEQLFLKIRKIDGENCKISRKAVEAIIVPPSESTAEYYAEKYGSRLKKSGKIMKPKLSLSGGVGFFTSEYIGANASSYVLDLEGTYFLSRHAGIRLGVNCNFFNRSNDNYFYPGYYEEGGNLTIYLISLDVLIGSLKPENKTNGYFVCGLGTIIFSESERTYHNYDYVNTYSGETYTSAGLKLGGGFNHGFSTKVYAGGEFLYGMALEAPQIGLISLKPKVSFKISKAFRIFIEPQYTFPVVFGGWGGFFIGEGYFTVKSGITLGSF